MELLDIKEKVLKELEEIYNTQGIKNFTYEIRVGANSIPFVYYSVEKVIMPD